MSHLIQFNFWPPILIALGGFNLPRLPLLSPGPICHIPQINRHSSRQQRLLPQPYWCVVAQTVHTASRLGQARWDMHLTWHDQLFDFRSQGAHGATLAVPRRILAGIFFIFF
jgi:hypothetical protein